MYRKVDLDISTVASKTDLMHQRLVRMQGRKNSISLVGPDHEVFFDSDDEKMRFKGKVKLAPADEPEINPLISRIMLERTSKDPSRRYMKRPESLKTTVTKKKFKKNIKSFKKVVPPKKALKKIYLSDNEDIEDEVECSELEELNELYS